MDQLPTKHWKTSIHVNLINNNLLYLYRSVVCVCLLALSTTKALNELYAAFSEARVLDDACLPFYHQSTTKIGRMSANFPLDGASSKPATATAEQTHVASVRNKLKINHGNKISLFNVAQSFYVNLPILSTYWVLFQLECSLLHIHIQN